MKRTDDFFGDLEGQLTAAAHARAAGTLRRRAPSWTRPAIAFAVTSIAAVAVVVAFAARSADVETPAGTTPAPSVTPAAPDGSPNPAVDCPVPGGLIERFPAIARPPSTPETQVPDLVMAKLRSDWRYPDLSLARRLPADDGDAGWTFYAVPIGHCPEKGLDGPSGVVAVYAFRDGTYEVSAIVADDVPPDDAVGVIPAGDRFVVIGAAPADAAGATLDFGTAGVADIRAAGGIVTGLLPVEFGMQAARTGDFEVAYDVTHEGPPASRDDEAASRDPRPVHILNATTVPGLGSKVREDLGERWTVVGVGNAPFQDAEDSAVHFTEDADKDTAREVAQRLGIGRIAAMEAPIAEAADGAAVVVVVGRDLTK